MAEFFPKHTSECPAGNLEKFVSFEKDRELSSSFGCYKLLSH
jgi:hypothetical protein